MTRRLSLIGFVLIGASSCSAAGFGIGVSTPRYHPEISQTPEAPRPWDAAPMMTGDDVRVRTVGATGWVHGTYRGDRGGHLVLGTKKCVERLISYQQIAELEVERGSYWVEGLALGLLLDATVLVFAAAAAQPKFGGSFGVGAR